MPKYEIVFVIKPPGPFGLPEEGILVHPGHPGPEICGPTLDRRSGKLVGYGTLPKYRDRPVSVQFESESASLRLQDNYLTITFLANDQTAFYQGMLRGTRFCVLLSAFQGRYYHPEFLQLLNAETGERVKTPTALPLGTFTLYSVEQLSKDAEKALLAVTNETLEKASAYFAHALFLRQVPLPEGYPSFHQYHTSSQIVLNFYKATSTIFGEPGIDRDAQSRYKQFGISTEVWEEAERVRQLRNEFDIAHYTRDWKPTEELRAAQNKAQTVAQRVILAYVDWLAEESRKAAASSR